MTFSNVEKDPDTPEEPDIKEVLHSRSVAFPADKGDAIGEHEHRSKGVELRHELTLEEKELAKAAYDQIDASVKPKGSGGKAKADDVKAADIHEHGLSFDTLAEELKTSFEPKEPGKSFGLDETEAQARLERDGKNVLSPPNKKSALSKVGTLRSHLPPTHSSSVHQLPIDNVNTIIIRQ